MSIQVEWLGEVPYGQALELQKQAVEDRAAGRTPDRLLLLEHPPSVTLGRSTRPENLLLPEGEMQARGIEVHRVARGGDVTYHGRGQLVGYPIVDLGARDRKDVVAWLRTMEEALIASLAAFSLPACREEGKTGVFLPATSPLRKIASIGVGVRRWVTWHGFALNVTLDLSEFDVIVPCGLEGVEMTSVAREIGREGGSLFDDVRDRVATCFEEALA